MKRLPDGSKLYSEAETRKSMSAMAKSVGCEKEFDILLAVTDKKLAGVTNEMEAANIKLEAVRSLELMLQSKPPTIEYDGKIVKF